MIPLNFWIFSGGIDDGGESGLLGDFSPSSPLHIGKTAPTLTTAASLSQSPSSPPFSGMPPQPSTTTSSTPAGGRPAPGRLEFSPEKAGMDVTPLNLDFLDRTQPPQPLALTSLTGKPKTRPKINVITCIMNAIEALKQGWAIFFRPRAILICFWPLGPHFQESGTKSYIITTNLGT